MGFLLSSFYRPPLLCSQVQDQTLTKWLLTKTKPLENFGETKKPDSCGFEDDMPMLKQGEKSGDKNGNWLMPQVIVLIIIGS